MKENTVKLGGLWINKTREGKVFMSGSFGYSAQILVFKNEYKKTDKDPDYIVYLGQKERKEKQETEINDSEVPF